MDSTVPVHARCSGSVRGEEAFDVALVEDADLDVGFLFAQLAYLAVLAGHQSLAQRGDLDVEVVVGGGRSRGWKADRGLPSE